MLTIDRISEVESPHVFCMALGARWFNQTGSVGAFGSPRDFAFLPVHGALGVWQPQLQVEIEATTFNKLSGLKESSTAILVNL